MPSREGAAVMSDDLRKMLDMAKQRGRDVTKILTEARKLSEHKALMATLRKNWSLMPKVKS